jgi:hypothetical protein
MTTTPGVEQHEEPFVSVGTSARAGIAMPTKQPNSERSG